MMIQKTIMLGGKPSLDVRIYSYQYDENYKYYVQMVAGTHEIFDVKNREGVSLTEDERSSIDILLSNMSIEPTYDCNIHVDLYVYVESSK